MLAAIAALTYARAAMAEEACAAIAIEAESAVTSRWPGLLSDVRDALAARDDVDRCARVVLGAHGDGIVVRVVLPDGRSAERTVSGRWDVLPTLAALLVIPRAASRVRAPESAATGDAELAPLAPAVPTLLPVTPDRTPVLVPAPSALRLGVSVSTGARIGDGHTGVGLGISAFIERSGWLLGFGARAERYQTLQGDRSGGALEVALLGGRRWWFGDIAFDWFGGPAAAFQGTSTFESQTPTGTTTQENTGIAPRLVVGTRATFGVRSSLRAFLGVDADIGPSRIGSDIPGEARLPRWTFGLVLGVTMGTP
jgi:hypothetical protein